MTPRKAGVLYLVLTLALGIASAGLVFYVILTGNSISLAANFILYPIMLGVCLFFMFISKEGPAEFFGFKKVRISTFFLTLLFFVLIYPVTNIVASVSNLLPGNPLGTLDDSPLGLMLFMSFVCAPFFEEIVFRGAIYRGFRNSGRVAGPIIMTALLFGLYHGNPTQFFYTGFLGIFLALIAEATGSLWMPMLVHFLFNFTGIMIPLAVSGVLESSEGAAGYANVISPVLSDAFGSFTAMVMQQPVPVEVDGAGQALLQTVTLVVAIVVFIVVTGIALLLMYLAVRLLRRIARREGRENIYLKTLPPKGNSRQTIWSISLIIGIAVSVVSVVAGMIGV